MSDIIVRGVMRCVGEAFLVPVPPEILGNNYTARPVEVRSTLGRCRTRILRTESGEVFLTLTRRQCEALKVEQGADEIELTISVVRERLKVEPPQDLEEALRLRGLCWKVLPERERHQAVALVREAQTPALRQARIAAVIAAVMDQT